MLYHSQISQSAWPTTTRSTIRLPRALTFSMVPSNSRNKTFSLSHIGKWASASPHSIKFDASNRSERPHFEHHPDCKNTSSHDNASIYVQYKSVTHEPSLQATPTQRWLAESSRDEPWRSYLFSPRTSLVQHPRHWKGPASATRAALVRPVDGGDYPKQPRDGG